MRLSVNLVYHGAEIVSAGCGNGPINAFVNGLNQTEALQDFGEIEIRHYEERSLSSGSQGNAITLIEITSKRGSSYGIGIHENIVVASFQAIVSAFNRLQKAQVEEAQVEEAERSLSVTSANLAPF